MWFQGILDIIKNTKHVEIVGNNIKVFNFFLIL